MEHASPVVHSCGELLGTMPTGKQDRAPVPEAKQRSPAGQSLSLQQASPHTRVPLAKRSAAASMQVSELQSLSSVQAAPLGTRSRVRHELVAVSQYWLLAQVTASHSCERHEPVCASQR
jgi:hypothetical protein